MNRIIIFLVLATAMMPAAGKAVGLEHTRCQMQQEPLGVAVAKPTFSWYLSSGQRGVKQTGWEIKVVCGKTKNYRNNSLHFL